MSAKRGKARDVKSYADISSSDDEPKNESQESQQSYTSYTSYTSVKSTGSKKNAAVGAARTTRSSSGLSPLAVHTGLSQGFENWDIDDDTVVVSEEKAKCFATVCIVHRSTTHKKQKQVKPYALQNTFFAFPKDINEQDKKLIDEKIRDIVVDFETQKYTVERKTFGLPFEVEGICRVTPGYNMTAKKVKAQPGQKRKNRDESEERKEADEEAGASGKKIRN
jgi:archaellin